METNYKTMTNRVRKAWTTEDIKKLEISLDRLYKAGIFTPNEYMRIDNLIMRKLYQIECINYKLERN
jgi:hypothetical protein